ncbi:hypothetical protein V5N11_028319 [Cardamine amara subsp. amara]|uniref:Uncharacterized protein n=1 Tax=Cardamine amara subsp. amara TaxID=228776 RepID=A0ABD1BYT9_CARAN
MAKKKVSRNSNGVSSEQQQMQTQKSAKLSRQSSMEDHDSSEEKFQNLKSLNAILLKQTMEKRQQIESLVQAKDSLEAEMARSGSEKTRLRDALCGSSDENFMLKIEMDLFMGFFESRVKEMGFKVDWLVKEKSDREIEIRDLKREGDDLLCKLESEREELSRVCDERDLIKDGFDLKSEEVNRLKESLVKMEMKEVSLGEEVGRLRSENDRMVKERRKREELIERVNKERSKVEKSLEERIGEIDELKREKIEVEMVKREQKETIVELEKKLETLNEIVKSLTEEEKGLRDQVIGLGKDLDEVMEKAKARAAIINALVKEKSVKESELEGLLVENNSIKKQMEMALVQFSDKEKLVEQLLHEKNNLVERVVNQEAVLVELSKQVDEEKHVAAQLQKDYDAQTKASEKLSCNIIQLKDAMAVVEVERDNAVKALAEEKRNQVALKEKVVELEKMFGATGKELEKIKAERVKLIKEKKELENRSESLRKEKVILQKDIVELKKATGVLKTELESANANAKRGLTMLKSMSSLVCGLENKKGEQKREKGMDLYSMELEAIKNAFKNKESMVEEMNKEVEKMKHSVEDAHKKKNIWTFVSSVTSLLMAVSVAYAASIK